MVKDMIHLQTTLYHGSMKISTEADFEKVIILNSLLLHKIITIQAHVFIRMPTVSRGNRFIPKEYRDQYYSPLDE